MMTNLEKEEAFFNALILETPIEISVRVCAQNLASLHYAAMSNLKDGTIPETDEQSVARHFNELIRNLHLFKRELLQLNYNQVPKRLFVKLGPAIEWMLKDVRRYLDLVDPCNDPIEDVRDAFLAVKEICRSESQPDDIDAATFARTVTDRMDQMILATRRLGKVTRSVEERRVIDRDRAKGKATRSGSSFLANGKGVSHFDRIGMEYKFVKVADPTHLVLFNRVVLEITAQSSWNLVDRMLKAHFNDEPFPLQRKDVDLLRTADERRLLGFIHRETLEEVGRRRRGNCKYTGNAWFVNTPAPTTSPSGTTDVPVR